MAANTSMAAGVAMSATDGGRLVIGDMCSIDRNATLIVKHGELILGDRVHIGVGTVICARDCIHIGDDTLIAEYVTVRDQDHAIQPGSLTRNTGFRTSPVRIGSNVWIGAKATITKGVTIGAGSVIGANSVVTRDIPSNVVVAGAPARLIRPITQSTTP